MNRTENLLEEAYKTQIAVLEKKKLMYPKGLQDQVGLLFFITVFWGFFSAFTVIFTFPQERAMLSKECESNMYRLSAYFVARTTSNLPLDLILPVLFLVVVYFMAGL